MRIKGISRIRNIGVYRDYHKPAETQEFGIKNLIFGWNYSGKTTLSRVFSLLEHKTLNDDFVDSEFIFDTDTGPVTEKNFRDSGILVRVFNSDFIRDNLHFEGSSFKPILLLGKESEEARSAISAKMERIKKSERIRARWKAQSDTMGQRMEDAKTEAARKIRQSLQIDPYNAKHLSRDLFALSNSSSSLLLSESKLGDQIQLAVTPDSMRPVSVPEFHVNLQFEALYAEAQEVLQSVPTLSNTLKHLDENPELEKWIEDGLHLHRGEGLCEFCGNHLNISRLDAFHSHFSKDLETHKQSIRSLLARVASAEIKLQLPKANELNPQFRNEYALSTTDLPSAVDGYNREVRRLAAEIQRKRDLPRAQIKLAPLADLWSSDVSALVAQLNEIIRANNQLAEDFPNMREQAAHKVKMHFLQDFYDRDQASGRQRIELRNHRRSTKLRALEEKLRNEIDLLQAQISRAQAGREKINSRLSSLLGDESVQIHVVREGEQKLERFQLLRKDGAHAKNLSDGERTAIAFSYFLTKLSELDAAEFQNTIVYIDDPISSLDSNHIFQITAAIRATFFRQEDGNSPWVTTCKQLFISTHNFEFFNLLREIKPEKEKQGAQMYLVKRMNQVSSTFENMPSSLARYQSEYQFLFDVINTFNNAPNKSDHSVLMLLPNAIRRFVELYTYARIPGKKSETVDSRAEKLFGPEKSKRILKVLHHFSHANTIDRLAGNSELIFDIEHAVRDLFEELDRLDYQHMEALREAVAEIP